MSKHIFVIIEWSRFFLDNPALSGVLEFCPLTSDQKLAKSQCRKYHNWHGDQPTNILAVELNFKKLRTATCSSHESHQRINWLDFFKLFDFFDFTTCQNWRNGQKSKFWTFLGFSCFILHNWVIQSGNY